MTEPYLLKKALKAFKKRLRLLRQDDESKLGVGPFSGGRSSVVAGIQPPPGFTTEVWEELAEAGRLTRESGGTYSLPEQR